VGWFCEFGSGNAAIDKLRRDKVVRNGIGQRAWRMAGRKEGEKVRKQKVRRSESKMWEGQKTEGGKVGW